VSVSVWCDRAAAPVGSACVGTRTGSIKHAGPEAIWPGRGRLACFTCDANRSSGKGGCCAGQWPVYPFACHVLLLVGGKKEYSTRALTHRVQY
jgi:hypothetical protein